MFQGDKNQAFCNKCPSAELFFITDIAYSSQIHSHLHLSLASRHTHKSIHRSYLISAVYDQTFLMCLTPYRLRTTLCFQEFVYGLMNRMCLLIDTTMEAYMRIAASSPDVAQQCDFKGLRRVVDFESAHLLPWSKINTSTVISHGVRQSMS